MRILEKILLATDFTESNNNAIESAITMAKTFNSKIILLHVLPKEVGNEKVMNLLNKTATRELIKLRDRIHKEGAETEEPILEHGDHLDRIIHVSESTNANLILIGAGANLENKPFRLGTTASKIIQKSDSPVMVIKSGKYLAVKKIICPVDFSDESSRALDNAMVMARRFQAELTILHVYDHEYQGPLSDIIDWDDHNQDLLDKHNKNFDSFLKRFNLVDIKWKKQIKRGDFAKIILDTIKTEKSDLLVIGTSGKRGLSRFFIGSITDKVIREVPCSFVTLKSEDLIELKLNAQIRDIETHFNNAKQLVKDGIYKAAINEYLICLKINEMHIPSLNGIADIYDTLGDSKNSDKFRQLSKDVMSRIWDSKIEAEARKYYKK